MSQLFRRCVFCGYPCYGRTCQWHRDLPQIEAELQNGGQADERDRQLA